MEVALRPLEVTNSSFVGGRVVVITHKACWSAPASPTGYVTDGGFPFQMKALAGLFDETVLMLPRGFGASPSGAADLAGPGLRVVSLGPLPAGAVARKLLFPFWLLRQLPAYHRELRRADAVHALVPGDVGSAGMLLAVMTGRPLFARHCGNWTASRNWASSITQGLMERWGGGRRVMLATGGADHPPSSRNPAIRWIFSSSLTEGQLRQLARRRTTAPGKDARLVIACRQEPAKGTGHIIESLPALAREFGGISLDVLGDGSAIDALRDQATKLGVSERIRFHGQVDHATVIRRMQEGDLFVFPTTSSEGFPKAVLEAMACGLPVVTTPVSVLPSLVGSRAGVILPEASGSAVAAAVANILGAPSTYMAMSRQAVETAARYSLERWRDQIGNLLLTGWGPLRARGASPGLGFGEERGANPGLIPAPRKVVMVAGTLGQGGAERQLFHQLKTLRRAGTEVRLLSLTQGEFWEEPIRRLGVPVTWVGRSSNRARRLLKIVAAVRSDLPDVIQSAHFFTNLYVSAAARLLGTVEIGAIRNNVTSEVADGVLGRFSLRQPRWLAANSRAGVATAQELGVPTSRCVLLPNVVDTDHFSPAPRRASPHVISLLSVGRLVEQKRMDRFLRVAAEVRRRWSKPLRTIVAGDGPKRAELEEQARRELDGEVEFLGAVADLRPIYREADVMVLASDWEGTPNVVMEAMACGLPVAAMAVGGVTEIVRPSETGLLAAAGDEDALARAVLSLVEDDSLRWKMGARGREVMEREHSLDILAAHLEALYQKVLE